MTAHTDLEGTLKVLPEPSHRLLEVVATEYASLTAEYGPRNVLVLKRHPAGLERVREQLAGETTDGTPLSPRLESLPEHASKVLEEYDPTLDRLEYEERIELISLVIAGAKREIPPYLEGAREHETFARDVGQLLLEVTRQRIRHADCADAHDCLAFLTAMNDRFHEVLDDRGLIERADVIPRVVELLQADADGLRTRITGSYDAVLALEFEEYRRLDREYLAQLTWETDTNTELVCLGERHASVERTRVESGRLEDLSSGLTVEEVDSPTVRTRDDSRSHSHSQSPPHRGITRYLATGEPPASDEQATARRIRAGTAREQVRQVAAEIQFLVDRHEWSHDEIAVAVPSVDRVPDARTGLRNAGIPTATIGTDSLKEDPAVNELYAVVSAYCDHDVELAHERLAARVPGVETPAESAPTPTPTPTSAFESHPQSHSRSQPTPESPDTHDPPSATISEVLESCADASVRRSLENWIVRTELKRRIAEEESWVDAAEQYQGVRRVLEIARFVEETDLVAPDWEGLRRMLRQTIKYDAPYVHDVETRSPTGGVTVCAIEDLKYDSREAVFLLDCTDGAYPGQQHLTQLFPTAWLKSMPQYPAVTDPDRESLERTFAPRARARAAKSDAAPRHGDPFAAYHAERSRRALALGTRAARSQLYCCTYERETEGLRRTHDQSRYLTLLESVPTIGFEDVDALGREAAIHGEANALEALLDEPRGELERILREASTGGEADLGETEALFEEIQVVLEEGDVDDDLARAVRTQFEFAAGEVVRRE
ncbi:hypothetical protein OB955_18255 [Halobacteria archaeon AArc-m2/3/4]|uniref:Superfamily I DNA or RNA helicase n=1 Tax=Natronoglomus mannanivorans TaxID=2979990 RepID=A0ABT2QIA8_9EURY|nr:hypothetical protein [Halobacteria archaeon AArc-m2/3/4]